MKDKNLVLFYLLSWTWGIVMSLIGGIVVLALLVTGHKPKMFCGRIYVEVGKNWGGLSLGCFFICMKDAPLYIKQHETGHTLQNIIFGPFTPFLVTIPSGIRYWYRMNRENKTEYDDIWFEGQATKWGKEIYEVRQTSER